MIKATLKYNRSTRSYEAVIETAEFCYFQPDTYFFGNEFEAIGHLVLNPSVGPSKAKARVALLNALFASRNSKSYAVVDSGDVVKLFAVSEN